MYFRYQNVLKMYLLVLFRRENIINCNMTSAICVGKRNDNLVVIVHYKLSEYVDVLFYQKYSQNML